MIFFRDDANAIMNFCKILIKLPDSMAKINAVSPPPLIAFMSAPFSINGSIKLSGPKTFFYFFISGFNIEVVHSHLVA